MSSLKRGFTPRLVDSYWAKGAAIMVCHDESTKDWLAARVLTLVAWKGSRLKMVGLDALPTYKRVVAWFLGPVKDTERYLLQLHRLNQGLDNGRWRVYERKEAPNGVCLVLSIDIASDAMLEGLRWRPFSGVNKPSSPFWAPSQKGRNKKKKKRRRPKGLWWVPFHLFRPTCSIALLLLE
jgi:hypothetical protein